MTLGDVCAGDSAVALPASGATVATRRGAEGEDLGSQAQPAIHLRLENGTGVRRSESLSVHDSNPSHPTPSTVVQEVGEGMTGLGDLKGGDLDSQVLGINDAGLKVGWGTTRNGKEAVIWNADGLTALKELVDATADGWLLLNASEINESGQIVGTAINPAGQNEAFLLTPQYQ